MTNTDTRKWNEGITKYQWLVLIIASLGWVFDVFEGQIFVASMRDAMPQLLGDADAGIVSFWNNVALGSFLLGGAQRARPSGHQHSGNLAFFGNRQALEDIVATDLVGDGSITFDVP